MSDITLTASIRSNLLSLQNTTNLLNTTSERLSTGKRVNSALDNPNSFFTARGLSNRAGDLSARKDSIGQSISLLQATDKSLNSITALVEQAKAVAQQAEEASSSGVATIATQAAVLSGVTTISTEAAASATGSVSAISSAAAAAATGSISTISTAATTAAAAGISSIHTEQGANITDSSTQNLTDIFGVTATDQFRLTAGDKSVIITSSDTLDTIKSTIESTLDNVTVTIDLTQDELNFATSGGGTLTFTDVDTDDDAVSELGLETSASVAVATGVATAAFTIAQDATDTVAAAYGVTATDTLTIAVEGGSGTTNNVVFTVGNKTVAELVTHIGNVDADVTASFNATSNQIDITSSNAGEKITFTSAAAATFAFDGGAGAIGTGVQQTYATGQTGSDTLLSAFAATATDVLSFNYNGATSTFTIGNQTIDQLATAISAIDADITATYNTTTDKIDITSGAGGAQLTIGNAVGDPLTELVFNNGTSNVASGTAETFLTSATSSDLVTAAFGVDASDTFDIALTNGGTATIVVGSQSIAELVTAISAADSSLTASFNTSTNKIDVSAATGTEITFTDATAVAQVDTLTLTGDVEAGDVHSVTVNGTTVSYTVIGADLTDNSASTNADRLDNVATKLAAAVNNDATIGALVTAAGTGGDSGALTITADTAGNKLNVSAITTNDAELAIAGVFVAEATPASDGVAQVDTIVVTGTVDAGDVLTYTLNGTDLSYTVTGLEADNDAIATAFAAVIQADANIATATAVGGTDTITITGNVTGEGLNTSFSVNTNDTAAAATVVNTTAAVGGGAIAGLTLDGVASTVTSGTAITYTDTTAAVVAGDLVTSGFANAAVGDSFTVATSTGGSSTISIGATTTITDLVTAIGNSDSALTASYNTTTKKIDISAATGTAVTFTNVSGSAISNLGLTDGTSALTNGGAVTYGSSGSASEVGSLNTDFQSILEQIDTLLSDASYKGTNLLSGSNDFIVKFNADGSSSLTLTGLNLGVTGNTDLKFTLDASGYDFTGTGITTALADTQNAIDHLRSVASTFGTGLGIIQTREDFTSELVSVLQSGADKLVNANLEEESANLLALQTRQALGIQSLSIANQSQQSVLSLFR